MTWLEPNEPDAGAAPAHTDNGAAPAVPANALNLDTLEREGTTPTAPFPFVHGGRTYHALSPHDIDWQDVIAAMSNPIIFFRKVLPAADQTSFFSTPMPSWKLNALMKAYYKHFGLPDAGEPAALPR